MDRGRLLRAGRLIGSLLLLGLALWLVDLPSVLARLGTLQPGWALIAVALTVTQTVGSAWRWRFTAARLGIELDTSAAVREYYLAAFLNQVVPGGVVGDVSRAVRHSRSGQPGAGDAPVGRRAIHAVLLERASGQLVVALAAAVSVGAFFGAGAAAAAAVASALLMALILGPARRAITRAGEHRTFVHDLGRGLVAPGVFTIQLLTSLAIVGSYMVTYVAAARAIGVDTPALVLLPLVTPVLLAMLLPVSIAGWGVREAAAAAIWAGVGLAAADGVAISLAYGVLVFVGALPGAVVAARVGTGRGAQAGKPVSPPTEDPGRTEDPSRGAGAAPEAAAPGRGGRSSEG